MSHLKIGIVWMYGLEYQHNICLFLLTLHQLKICLFKKWNWFSDTHKTFSNLFFCELGKNRVFGLKVSLKNDHFFTTVLVYHLTMLETNVPEPRWWGGASARSQTLNWQDTLPQLLISFLPLNPAYISNIKAENSVPPRLSQPVA